MKEAKGYLFVVSGPSGVGKSTLIRRFLAEDKKSVFSVSYTTRQKRLNEVEGKDYYFVDVDTFNDTINKNGFLEWENVYTYLYGTPKKEVLEALKSGKDVVLDIDVKGALRVKSQHPDAFLIFIQPPSLYELKNRLLFRGEKEIEARSKRVEEEVEKKGYFDYTVINDNVDEAYREFKHIIEKIREEKWQE